MKIRYSILGILLASCATVPITAKGDYPVDYEVSLTAGGGSGEFAPYYISALRGGRLSSRNNLQAEGMVKRQMDLSDRFSYGFGIDLIG
ncbi:MAG: hypothetical protein K2I12_08300, partial [Duncaniella sp.]|nr:hypothetical protein [Duncaniella sp.]